MENPMAEGSQTFEEDLARLIMQTASTARPGIAHADSPTNLVWRLQNDFSLAAKAATTSKDARDVQTRTTCPRSPTCSTCADADPVFSCHEPCASAEQLIARPRSPPGRREMR